MAKSSKQTMDFSISSDILAELLEVAINVILHAREVYPGYMFRRRKKYNIPVQMCIYPEMKTYIGDCVASIKNELERGMVEKLFVCILSKENVLLEKFVFDIKQESIRPYDIKKDPELLKMEEALRAFCLKLSISDSLLKPLPPNCSFRVQIQVPEQCHMDDREFPWIEPEDSHKNIKNSHIVPLKSLKSEICDLQLYVEERTDS